MAPATDISKETLQAIVGKMPTLVAADGTILTADTATSNDSVIKLAGLAGGPAGVSPLLHVLYDIEGPLNLKLPDRVNSVFRRSLIYSSMDASVSSSGSVYHTNFFGAASDVTSLFGLTGAQAVSMISSPIDAWPFSPVTLQNMQKLGGDLYQYVNVPLYRAVYNGDSNYRLQSGITLGSAAGRGTSFLDYSLVHNEQTYVQKFLNQLPPTQRGMMISEANNALSFSVSGPVVQAMKDLGSGLIDYSQKMTVAAMQMADMKVCAQRS